MRNMFKVGKLVFKDEGALHDFARKNNAEIHYMLNEYPEPEINPEKPSELKPMLRAILWAFDEEKQILTVGCFEPSRISHGIWTKEDERHIELQQRIKRLKDHYQFQPELLAIVEEMEKTYEGSQF